MQFNFSADSAFSFLQKQCDFGPRIPNTPAHVACAAYLEDKLSEYGALVTLQKFDAKAYNGEILHSTNIIAQINPSHPKRIALFAHWDSRPYCDNDAEVNWMSPVLGANDGASGVAVLLELARIWQQKAPSVGVDVVLFDSEDYGTPAFVQSDSEDTWCLGSQYWGAKKPYSVKPIYGVLFNMVGGVNPNFGYDVISQQFAPEILAKVWSVAHSLGYSQTFVSKTSGSIVDDHYYVNILTGIPTIDIIDFSPNRGFPSTWHTIYDTPQNIDKESLKMVGNVLELLINLSKTLNKETVFEGVETKEQRDFLKSIDCDQAQRRTAVNQYVVIVLNHGRKHVQHNPFAVAAVQHLYFRPDKVNVTGDYI